MLGLRLRPRGRILLFGTPRKVAKVYEAKPDSMPSDLSFIVTEDVEGSHEGRSMETTSDSKGEGVADTGISTLAPGIR